MVNMLNSVSPPVTELRFGELQHNALEPIISVYVMTIFWGFIKLQVKVHGTMNK